MNKKKLVTDAMLVAMYVVLGMVGTLDLVSMKISIASLPIIVGALLMGPVDGLMIGLVGALIEQMLKYGFTATTVLWLLPACARGLMVGLYAKKKQFDLNTVHVGAILLPSAIVVTIINTFVWYLDSKIYNYYTPELVFGDFFLRIVTGIITMIVFTVILPPIIRILKKNVRI